MLEINETKPNVFYIRYDGATIGIVEKIRIYGNTQYKCHFNWVSAVYNSRADAISHLLWRSGMTIAEADRIAGAT